jgi:hypothetical protein
MGIDKKSKYKIKKISLANIVPNFPRKYRAKSQDLSKNFANRSGGYI